MRRIWMLLLVVALMVIALAVPAMAADHTGHEEWTVLKSGDTALTEGSYYLTGNIDASITSTSGNITICLSGYQWQGVDGRPLTVTSGSVTICDCTYAEPAVADDGTVAQAAGGKILGHSYGTATSSSGGAIKISSGASLMMEGGTVTGGTALYGGNIYNQGTLEISGGVVRDGSSNFAVDGSSGQGANIYQTGGSLTISGGIITGGVSKGNGGNIRASNCAFSMTGGKILNGYSADNGGNIMTTAGVSITGGEIAYGTATAGGNISVNIATTASNKTLVLTGVTIKNGSCGTKNLTTGAVTLNKQFGGNVRVFSKSPESVTIGDGTVITGGATNATNGSKNVYIGKPTTVNIGSATIDGYVLITKADADTTVSTVNLSGAPSITGGTTNLSIGTSPLNAADMTAGAKVGITATGEGRAFSGTVDAAYANYFFADSGSELDVAYNSATGYQCMWLADKWCVCGASKTGGKHIQFTDANGSAVGCDGTEVFWLPVKSKIPTGTGNYYLTQNVQGLYNPEENAAINLDLNNWSITNSNRVISARNGVVLTITDTSADKGGRIYKADSEYSGQGGLLWVRGTASVALFAGKLEYESTASNPYEINDGCGAAVCVYNDTSVFNMYGGEIAGGNATANYGGNVWVNGTMNMYAGIVTGGTDASTDNISGNMFITDTLNLYGGSVAGCVDASSAKAVNIYGGQISGGTTNLNLGTKTITVSSALADGTDVIISRTDGGLNTVVASNVTAYNGGIHYQGGKYLVVRDASTNELALQASGAIVKSDSARGYANLAQALEAAESGDYVCMMADNGDNISFAGELYLDLNGYDINGNITITDGTLYLLDSQTADYSVKNGEELTGFGTITGTITGNVARAFTTSAIKVNYDNHNYRYMVICENGAYSSHRIYLAVKSTILYPQKPALNYRTVLRCDEYLAARINNGGGYGVLLTSNAYDADEENNVGAQSRIYGNYLDWGKTVLPYSATEENNLVTQLNEILDDEDKGSAENQYRAAANVKAQAYIWIADDLCGSLEQTAENISTHGVTSSGVSYSLKNLILRADSMWDGLSTGQKTALGGMYGRWKALMESWNLENIPSMEDADVRYGCLCGDPDSTDNPCAENGHVEFAWELWDSTTSLPTDSGTYYLSDDVTLTSTQLHVEAADHINLNLHGCTITTGEGENAKRVARVQGIFNLTNYAYDGETSVDSATVSGCCNEDGNGGALLVQAGGNVSVYNNVTLQSTATHQIKEGVVAVSGTGSLNVYGGNIIGADMLDKSGNGGAVYVYSGGSMYMNAGTISGGKALQGGAIYAAGTVTIEGGTVQNGQAGSDESDGYGGNIYIANGGAVILSGGTVKDGTANGDNYGQGGNFYVAATGTLELSGTAQIQKGYSKQNGGSIYVASGTGNEHAGLTMTGGSITSGHGGNTAGNLYVGNAIVKISGGTISGGRTGSKADTTSATANIYVVSGTLDLSGGTIHGGVYINSYSGQATLSLSGTPTVSGNGILLTHNYKTVGDEAVYYPINVELDLESLNNDTASVVLRYTKFEGDYTDGLCLASATESWENHPYEKVARKMLCDYAGSNDCEISYEDDGIYIRKSTQDQMKWTCTCGANYGVDDHVNGCDHFDVKWSEWNLSSKSMKMPNEPGYWYINSSTKTNNAGVEYVAGLTQTNFAPDYYFDGSGYQQVYTVRAKDTSGAYTTNNVGKYVSVAEYLKTNNGVPTYAAAVGSLCSQENDVAYVAYENGNWVAYTAGEFAHEVLSEYSVHIDLNGLKLETAAAARAVSFRGINTKAVDGVTHSTCRNGDVTLNLIDSSDGHTGAIATYGVYTGVTADGKQTYFSSSGDQGQGKMIWMDSSYNSGDKLNTSYVTLDASSTITGSGLVLYNNGGSANFWNTTIIGGTAQGFYRNEENTNTDINNDGKIKDTIGASGMRHGGGALMITGGGTITVNGGSISGGKAIYRYMRDEYGKYHDQAVGGGNVFVDDGTFIVDGGTITDGMALVYGGGDTVAYNTYGNITGSNDTPEYRYGSGGGVYVLKGKVILKNGATITNNYTGTITGQVFEPTETNANIYNCVNPTGTISNTAKDNVFLGGNPMELVNLTGTVGYNMGGYVGTFATYTGTAPTQKTLVCDDSTAVSFLTNSTKGRLYYPAKDDNNNLLTGENVYLVGYGKASVQPSLEDLQAGLNMDNYGNVRNTATLYNGEYYDIITDNNDYLVGAWDTQCYATALATTDNEGDTVIIIALDGRSFAEDIANIVKRMVSNATGVPLDNITISSGHQHSVPGPARTYSGLDSQGDAIVTMNYLKTYYSGIVEAAVAAMEDRAQATVKVGTLQTTADGKQYSFVRNMKLTNGTTFMGMVTDNYKELFNNDSTWTNWTMAGTLETYTNLTISYESEADTSMQLVQYTRPGADTIVMANFQTHPHLGTNSESSYVHSDVIGAFRDNLEALSGCKVLYFSGASADINCNTYIADDRTKYPWADRVLATSGNTLQPLEKASIWGQSLATMADNFLNGTTYQNSVAMAAVSASTDVEVKVENVACTLKKSDASMTGIQNAATVRNWSTGEAAATFDFSNYDTWKTYVGNYTSGEDRVYSKFDATNIRRSLLWQEAGKTTEKLPVTAYAMGDIGFIAAPYEMFHKNGSEIKDGSDFTMTIVATLANGGNSYIPSDIAYNNGGYSVDQSRYQSGTGEIMAQRFVAMLNGLR